jgi:hypothetical protein
MSPQDLLNKLHDRPFQPFRVKLSDASTFDVLDPGNVVVGPTSAILPVDTMLDESGFRLVKRWRTIALAHITQFIEIEPPKEKRSKRAR